DEAAGASGHVDALPQGQRADEGRRVVLGEAADEGGELVLSLAQDGGVELGAQQLGGLLGGAPRGEQPERPAAGGADELDELALGVLAGTFPSRGGQVAGDVEDALASVVERGADVDAPPARRAAVAARPGRAVTRSE